MNIRTDILWRVYLVYAIIFVCAFGVVFKLCKIQLVDGKKWTAMADSLSTRYMNIVANRGNIYADDGSLLATSLPEYELRLDAGVMADDPDLFHEKVDSLSACLAGVFHDRTATDYKRLLQKVCARKDRYVLLMNKVSYDKLKLIKTFPIFNQGQYHSGLIAIQLNKRIKPFGDLAQRTIGYYTKTVQPVGLEGAYREFLAGKDGKQLVERVAGGIWLPLRDEAEITPVDGSDIVSTINVNIQDVAQNSLLKYMSIHNAEHGCVVVMEVKTGEIKAIANLTRNASGKYDEKFNYAFGEAAEPGSTFKLASYMVALDDHKLDTNTLVNVNGGITKLYNHIIRDAEAGDHQITVKQAFEKSSNVAVATLINDRYKNEPARFTAGLYRLGLNQRLNLQVPGEARPRIKTPKSGDWSKLSLPQMAYGYEVVLTPMQMLTLYNGVANDGKIIAPLLVKEIDRLGKPVRQFESRVINPKMCSGSTLRKVRSMLEGVVLEGTAKSMHNKLYSIAGKTGTAQIAQGAAGYNVGGVKYQSSFCGYFPADRPRYSMIIVMNNPTGGQYYAAQVAGPVFLDIANKIYSTQLDMHQAYAVVAKK